MTKPRQILIWRRGTNMSEWYAADIDLDSRTVVRAVRMPSDEDATNPASYYLSSYPPIDPSFINESPSQFYCSDTCQPLSRHGMIDEKGSQQ